MSRFRIAKPADVDPIIAMMRGYYAQDGYTFVEADARAAALMLIKDPHLGSLWVTCDDELFIAESYRGRGLGREALEVAEAYCREAQVAYWVKTRAASRCGSARSSALGPA